MSDNVRMHLDLKISNTKGNNSRSHIHIVFYGNISPSPREHGEYSVNDNFESGQLDLSP